MTTYTYERYLSAKKTVDDRALYRGACEEVRKHLARVRARPWQILEVGGGIGTMVARLIEWELLGRAEYLIVGESAELLAHARRWLAEWAAARGASCDVSADGIVIQSRGVDVRVRLYHSDVQTFLDRKDASTKADLLIANAFLDLVDLTATLPALLTQLSADGMYWFTINYDGETIFLPEHRLDAELLRVYNHSMDERRRGEGRAGDSKTGRHLFQHLKGIGASPTAVGASDWVVHPVGDTYAADEAYFLRHIVNTVDAELQRHSLIAPSDRIEWSGLRHAQIARGELVYIAHQLDFAGTVSSAALAQ
jgi:SAM-dependent methyltransferase